jgi:hypothetical protein
MSKMKFKDAPKGARFKYPTQYSDDGSIWVKIHSYPETDGLIVEWKGNVEGHQSHCSFCDEEKNIDFDTLITLL